MSKQCVPTWRCVNDKMPRKTKKDEIIELLYYKGITDLLDVESSDEEEAEEVKMNVDREIEAV